MTSCLLSDEDVDEDADTSDRVKFIYVTTRHQAAGAAVTVENVLMPATAPHQPPCIQGFIVTKQPVHFIIVSGFQQNTGVCVHTHTLLCSAVTGIKVQS